MSEHDATRPVSTDDAPADESAGSDDAGTFASRPGDSAEAQRLDPTRYGDWEKNGRCIDF